MVHVLENLTTLSEHKSLSMGVLFLILLLPPKQSPSSAHKTSQPQPVHPDTSPVSYRVDDS